MPEMNEYEYLDSAPEYAQDTASMINWSANCEWHNSPYALYLDLIGESEERFGENLTTSVPSLGYIELDKLAKALTEYANRPNDIREWLAGLEEIANAEIYS